MDIHVVTTQEILDRISRHCPESLSTYLQCINMQGNSSSVFFSKQLVEIDMSESWSKFRNNIKKLAREHLLEWHPFNGGIAITLASYDDEESNDD